MKWKKRAARIAVAIFFAVLTIVGLEANGEYGRPADEIWEQITLQENLHEYAALLLGEESTAAQWYAQQGVERISRSTERDHGLSAYYAAGPIVLALSNAPRERMLVWHTVTWLWFMAGCWALYAIGHETGLNRLTSCLGALLLYLCPRFFAEGHYNSKDVVLLSLFLTTIWLGVRFLKQPGFLRGALLSLSGAITANIRLIGLFPWALAGLAAVVLVTAQRRWSKRMAATALSTIGLFVLFYVLLTPACWQNPKEYLEYLLQSSSDFTRWKGVVLFRDYVFDQMKEPLPWYYIAWNMMVTLPLYVLPLACVGQISVLMRVIRQKGKALTDPVTVTLLLVSLCWSVPMVAFVFCKPTVYNSWRHFYFVFAGLAVLGTHGIQACWRLLRKYGGDCDMQYVFVAGLVLFYGWTAADIARNHPYEYAYFNRLGHEGAETGMEMDYWTVSAVNAMNALAECDERNQELPLELGALEPMSWNAIRYGRDVLEDEVKQQLDIAEQREKAPYLYSNTTYARIYRTASPEGYRPLIELKSYDLTIATVYERIE